jgi:hypothetical protein
MKANVVETKRIRAQQRGLIVAGCGSFDSDITVFRDNDLSLARYIEKWSAGSDSEILPTREEQCHNLRLQAVVLISELRAWARPSGPSRLY